MPREKSAGAVIYREENGKRLYLLLQYTQKHWDFPKGHGEEKESEIETVRREVKEETGIGDLRTEKGFREIIKYFFRARYEVKKEDKNKAPLVFKMVVFYLAETNIKDIKLSFEHIGYKWLEYDDAIKQLNHKNARNILEKANIFLKNR